MKMKLSLFSAILFASAAAAALPLAGPSTGGGGFVVTCPATPLGPASTELLDIYEAKANLGFVLATASGSLADDYFSSVQRVYSLQGHPELANEYRSEILLNLRKFFLSTKFVENSQMPVADDLGERPWIPSSCEIRQIAFFDDASETIFMRKDLFDQLDSLNQAALVQHELWYKSLRGLKDTTSQLARLAVGHAFALRGIVSTKDGISAESRHLSASNIADVPVSADGSSWTNEVSDFHVTPMISVTGRILRWQFDSIQGRPLLAKTWVDVPYLDLNMKFGHSISNPRLAGCIVQTPDQSVELEAPIQGSMVKDLSVRLTYRTGEPVTLTLLRKGEVISTGSVSGCLE